MPMMVTYFANSVLVVIRIQACDSYDFYRTLRFLMRQATLSLNKLLLFFHNSKSYNTILMPILCTIWPMSVSENEKNQYQDNNRCA